MKYKVCGPLGVIKYKCFSQLNQKIKRKLKLLCFAGI